MKKLMRIALVFALAGATLVGCTKDYSGDISDLNKKVSEQQAAVTALQSAVSNAQTAADAAASTANTALTTAKAAATADELNAVKAELAKAATADALAAVDAKYAAYIPAIEAAAKAADLEALEAATAVAIAATNVSIEDLKAALAAHKAEFDAAVERILALETNYIALEARVKALEAADEEIQKLVDANAKGIEANAEDIEALQKLVEALTAQVEGNFSVVALTEETRNRGEFWPSTKPATYSFAKWNPGTTKGEQALFAKLVKEFPELAEIKKGTAVESFGTLPFIVNPSTTVLDDTYTFSLVNKDGEDSGIKLGNPTLGYAVKAGSNVWNVEVQSPSFNKYGKPVYDRVSDLSLVVESAEGVSAQTAFDYVVRAFDADNTPFTIDAQDVEDFVFDGSNNFDAFAEDEDGNAMFSFPGAPLYDNYFIIEADAADVEEFDIEIEGSEISFNKVPVAGGNVEFTITAVGVNGTTKTSSAKLSFVGTIAPNAELAAKEVTLGYKNGYDVAVDYAVADFEFSALEWKKVYEALSKNSTVKADNGAGVNNVLKFYKADGKTEVTPTTEKKEYNTVAFMRVYVNSQAALPGTYTITITDGAVFCGEGEITIKNPETSPVALIKALCKEGVLQIVGASDGTTITYDLNNALVFDEAEVDVVENSFYDEDQTSSDEDNWVKDGQTVTIAVADKLLYTERNFSVKFGWFTNPKNEGTFNFKAQVVSPIYAEGGKGAVEVANQTIYLDAADKKAEPDAFEVNKIIKSAKYVAGDDVNKPYNVFNTWTGKTATEYWPNYSKPNKSVSGYILTGKEGKVKSFTRDDLFNLELIGAEDWMLLSDKGVYYLKLDGNFDGTSSGKTNWDITAANWGTDVYYDAATKSIKVKYQKPKGEQKIKVHLGSRYGYDLGYYEVTKTCFAETAAEINSHDFNFKSNENQNSRRNRVEQYVNNAIGNEGTYNESAVMFLKHKDDIATYPAGSATEGNYIKKAGSGEPTCNLDVAEEIDVVKIGFKNPVEAAKFIEKVEEIDDAYLDSDSCLITVNPDAEFKAGLTSVDLPAYIKIADTWGMTMEIPFTVTVKVASK